MRRGQPADRSAPRFSLHARGGIAITARLRRLTETFAAARRPATMDADRRLMITTGAEPDGPAVIACGETRIGGVGSDLVTIHIPRCYVARGSCCRCDSRRCDVLPVCCAVDVTADATVQ